jgi:hypothetical protein
MLNWNSLKCDYGWFHHTFLFFSYWGRSCPGLLIWVENTQMIGSFALSLFSESLSVTSHHTLSLRTRCCKALSCRYLDLWEVWEKVDCWNKNMKLKSPVQVCAQSPGLLGRYSDTQVMSHWITSIWTCYLNVHIFVKLNNTKLFCSSLKCMKHRPWKYGWEQCYLSLGSCGSSSVS